MPGPIDELRHQLGGEPSLALTELAPQEQQRLAELIGAARRRQHEALEHAIDNGLGFVPRLARVPVKRALFG